MGRMSTLQRRGVRGVLGPSSVLPEASLPDPVQAQASSGQTGTVSYRWLSQTLRSSPRRPAPEEAPSAGVGWCLRRPCHPHPQGMLSAQVNPRAVRDLSWGRQAFLHPAPLSGTRSRCLVVISEQAQSWTEPLAAFRNTKRNVVISSWLSSFCSSRHPQPSSPHPPGTREMIS